MVKKQFIIRGIEDWVVKVKHQNTTYLWEIIKFSVSKHIWIFANIAFYYCQHDAQFLTTRFCSLMPWFYTSGFMLRLQTWFCSLMLWFDEFFDTSGFRLQLYFVVWCRDLTSFFYTSGFRLQLQTWTKHLPDLMQYLPSYLRSINTMKHRASLPKR